MGARRRSARPGPLKLNRNRPVVLTPALAHSYMRCGADGSQLRRLSELQAGAPSFSPGGKRLAVYESSGSSLTLSLIEDSAVRRLATFSSNRAWGA